VVAWAAAWNIEGAQTMKDLWDSLKGKKTYIGLATGIAVILLHKAGVPTPGIQIDDQAIFNNLWTMALAATFRHGIG